MEKYVVLDIETTGLYFEAWDEPIEVCAIKYENDKETIFHKYMKPYKKLPVKVEQLTKITNKFLEDKPSKYKVLPELREFIGDAPVICHNVSFDVPHLNFWFNFLGLPLITERFCTMKCFKKNTGRKKGSLAEALDYFSIINNQAHSAIEDTKATNKLFKVMKEQYDISFEQFTDEEAYIEIMKRVCKSRTHVKIKDVLCSVEKLDKRGEGLLNCSDEELIGYFKKFKSPDILNANVTASYEHMIMLFKDWINMINLSMYYSIISDDSIYKFAKSVVMRADTFEDVKRIHKTIYQTDDINTLYYVLVYRIEKEAHLMKYSVEDFDYYFSRGTSIKELSRKTNLSETDIIGYFVQWAEFYKKEKKDEIRHYLVNRHSLINAIKNGPSNTEEKITLELYNKNFFNVNI